MCNDAFAIFPILETERLVLRRLEMSDTDDVYGYAQDKDAFVFTDGFPQEREQVEFFVDAWRNEAYNSTQFIRWAVELKSEGRVVGGVYLFAPEGNDESGRKMDIGVEISRRYWNCGYAAEAIETASRYALTDMGLKRVQAQIIPENKGSVRAFEKAGFVVEGTLRNFCHYQVNGNVLRTMIILSRTPGEIYS